MKTLSYRHYVIGVLTVFLGCALGRGVQDEVAVQILKNMIFLHRMPSWFGENVRVCGCFYHVEVASGNKTSDYPEDLIKNELERIAKEVSESANGTGNIYESVLYFYKYVAMQCNWEIRGKRIACEMEKWCDQSLDNYLKKVLIEEPELKETFENHISYDAEKIIRRQLRKLPLSENMKKKVETKVQDALWKNPNHLVPK